MRRAGGLDVLGFCRVHSEIQEQQRHQAAIGVGEMLVDLESSMLWLRRQLELETSEPPLMDKTEVVQRWRLCKGQVAEHGFRVAVNALKCAGTSGTSNSQPYARGLRDMAMALVQAFPAERGRLMAAQLEITETEQSQFGVKAV